MQKRRPAAVLESVLAVGVYETGFGLARRAVLPGNDLDDRLAGGCQPVLPLAWGLWLLIDGQEQASAERAPTVLGSVEP